MTDVLRRLPETVADARGTHRAQVLARQRGDGSWEGWIEFAPADAASSLKYTTPIETHQRDRVALERWASGLTAVYAEGALARARMSHQDAATSELQAALIEIVAALDRRIPHVERAGEQQIAADAERLRASAIQRLALLPDGTLVP